MGTDKNIKLHIVTDIKIIKMPRNIEIKAKIDNIESFKELVVKYCTEPGKVLQQHDTFFNTSDGRLKLRVQSDPSLKELIYYKRADKEGPKLCSYAVYYPDDSDSLKEVLEKCYGIRGTVEKTRTLYMYGQTRIHVDEVVGLGSFMELEVVLRDEQSIDEGTEIANDLMQKLNVHELLTSAYMDMLEKK